MTEAIVCSTCDSCWVQIETLSILSTIAWFQHGLELSIRFVQCGLQVHLDVVDATQLLHLNHGRRWV